MERKPLIKQDMAALRRDVLPVSPFGLLSQSFTQEILDRVESKPGMYPWSELELLREGEEEAGEAPGAAVKLEVQLKLILERLKEKGASPETERILQKVESIRVQRETSAPSRQLGGARRQTAVTVPLDGGRRDWTLAGAKSAAGAAAMLGRGPVTVMGLGKSGGHPMGRPPKGPVDTETPMEQRRREAVGRPAMDVSALRQRFQAELTQPEARPARRDAEHPVMKHEMERPAGIPAGLERHEGIPAFLEHTRTPLELLSPEEQAATGEKTAERSGREAARQMETAAAEAAKQMAQAMERQSRAVIEGGVEGTGVPAAPKGRISGSDKQLFAQEGAAEEHKAEQKTEQIVGSLPRQLPESEAENEREGAQAPILQADRETAVSAMSETAFPAGPTPLALEHTGEQTPPTPEGDTSSVAAGLTRALNQAARAAVETLPISQGRSEEAAKALPVSHGSAAEEYQTEQKTKQMIGSLPRQTPEIEAENEGEGAQGPILQANRETAVGTMKETAFPADPAPLTLEHMGEQVSPTPEETTPSAAAGLTRALNQAARAVAEALPVSQRSVAEEYNTGSLPRQMPEIEAEHEREGAQTPILQADREAAVSAMSEAAFPAGPVPLALEHMEEPAPSAPEGDTPVIAAGLTQALARAVQTAVEGLPVSHGRAAEEHITGSQPRQTPETEAKHESEGAQAPIFQADKAAAVSGMNAASAAGTVSATGEMAVPAGFVPLALEHTQEPAQPAPEGAAPTGPEGLTRILDRAAKAAAERLPLSPGSAARGQAAERAAEHAAEKKMRQTALPAQTPGHETEYGAEDRQTPLPRAEKAAAVSAMEALAATGSAGVMGERAFSGSLPPLTLEHAQEQPFAAQPAETLAAPSPQVLEKLLDTPGMRLLSKEMATLSRQAAAVRQETARRETAYQETRRRMTAGSLPRSMGTARPMGAAAGKGSPARQSSPTGRMPGGAEGIPGALGQMVQLPVELAHMPEDRTAQQSLPGAGTSASQAARQKSAAQGRRTQTGAAAWSAQQETYPALRMEHASPYVAMARQLKQTVAREMGERTQAAKAMEEKAQPESMQTLDLMTEPQIQEQVVWQNPYMRGAPAEMTYRQKNAPGKDPRQSSQSVRISDAEIRRTADKVFKLVQEKITAERRRTGRI